MSEMELSIFRQRVSEARKLKAKRGELFGTIAGGYRKVAHEDRIEKEPDQRVQQAIKPMTPSKAGGLKGNRQRRL